MYKTGLLITLSWVLNLSKYTHSDHIRIFDSWESTASTIDEWYEQFESRRSEDNVNEGWS